ncbi:MAG TPA: hypothetical protein VLK82_12875 [Candidatus Tectomicrobia bacterium]|nr:hypothetical protein [Candidatus Tectomicrobia bacterium]
MAAQTVLPKHEPAFGGNIAKTYKHSTLDFPQPPKAPEGVRLG